LEYNARCEVLLSGTIFIAEGTWTKSMFAIRDALEGAKEQLAYCQQALAFFEVKDESSRKLGANIILQFGRAVTYGMEHLAKQDPAFAAWYLTHDAQLHANPIFKHFREVRNIVVHRSGKIDFHHISRFPVHDPKPGAIEELTADGSTICHMSMDLINNRRFLVVRTPDGRREERDFPQKREGPWWKWVDIQTYFKDAPPEFASVTVVQSCQAYVSFLERILLEAEAKFGA
jgi:hypothetical protein